MLAGFSFQADSRRLLGKSRLLAWSSGHWLRRHTAAHPRLNAALALVGQFGRIGGSCYSLVLRNTVATGSANDGRYNDSQSKEQSA